MATQLRVKKGMLTRARNTLTTAVGELPQLPDNLDQPGDDPDYLTHLQAALIRHKEAISQASVAVENRTTELTVLVDQLQLSDDDKVSCNTFVDEAVDHLQDAQRTVHKLSALLAEIAVIAQQQRDTDNEDDDDQPLRPAAPQAAAQDQAAQFQQMLLQQAASHAQLLTALTNLTVQKPALPHLQLPKFSGKRWEWDKFYSQFEALVHSRNDVEEIQKFTYLLNCLSDEPKAFIKELQVTSTNYAVALDILQNRYGDNQMLIDELNRNLQALKAASPGPSDQRQLLNSVSALTRQLLAKGEQLDNRLTLNMILSKFSKSVQRKVFEKEIALPTGSAWALRQLTAALESTIAQQEKIEQLTNSCNQSTHSSTQEDKKRDDKRKWKTDFRNTGSHRRPCRYCKGEDHFDNACTVYATASQRQQRLKELRCCVNCGSSYHLTTACPHGDCSNCPGFKHIRSACPKAANASAPRTNRPTSTTAPFAKVPSKPTVSGFGARRGSPSKPTVVGPAHRSPPFKKTANYVSVEDNRSAEENKPTPTKEDIFPRHGFHVEGGNGADQSYLMMAKASYLDADGNLAAVHILMDPGSDVSFVRSSFADALHLQTVGAVSMRLNTFASKGSQRKIFEIVDLVILDPNGKRHSFRLPKSEEITGKLLIPRLNQQDCAFLHDKKLQLSLDSDNTKLRPDILIGADIFWNLWLDDAAPIRLPSGLRLIPTVLGHVITGSLRFKKRRSTCAINVVRRVTRLTTAEPFLGTDTESFDEDDSESESDRWAPPDAPRYRMATAEEISEEEGDISNLANALLKGQQQDFIDIPEYQGPERLAKKATDQKVLQFFNSAIRKTEKGYTVRLPMTDEKDKLPSNLAIAESRLKSLLHKFAGQRFSEFDLYNSIFAQQEADGIIERVPREQWSTPERCHYLSFQGVARPGHATTPLRIVFDASGHFRGSVSLNDVVHQGPTLLPNNVGILQRFRTHRYGLISDVEKAFLQVWLDEHDRDYQRFLWVVDPNLPPEGDNLIVYRITRVTFGVNASPFLLGATIAHHCHQTGDDHAISLLDDLYVDNLIHGADSLDELIQNYEFSKKLFKDMNMNIREFMSNHPLFFACADSNDLSEKTAMKVLGVGWDAETDRLMFYCFVPAAETKVTKRTVTSQLHSIYDPLGIMVPLLLPMKLFIQQLWRNGYDWDKLLDDKLVELLKRITDDMDGFSYSPERYIGNKIEKLFGFADASHHTMGACIYTTNWENRGCLLQGSSKLLSVSENCTIPKMELRALVMVADLLLEYQNQLRKKVDIKEVYIFSDSEICLAWLKKPPRKKDCGIFVYNRIKEITAAVNKLKALGIHVLFAYVHTSMNPADWATRGATRIELSSDHIWFHGPDFIKKDTALWPAQSMPFSLPEPTGELLPEKTVNVVATEQTEDREFPLKHFRSLIRSKRAVARALRFIRKLAKKGLPPDRFKQILGKVPALQKEFVDALSGPEILQAHRLLLQMHQANHLTDDKIKALKNLNLQKDSKGLYRCIGRLDHADMCPSGRRPIYIAPNTELAHLLIQESHQIHHRSVAHTIATVRELYWIPRIRQQVRKLIRRCVPCQRQHNLPYKYPDCTNLPPMRVQYSKPFENIGLDYFGPLMVLTVEGTSKAYGCIFTCTVTRALHLDVAPNATTEAFLNCLRRFFAAHGIPKNIVSDNAPIFILGEQILKDGMTALERTCADNGITWKTITPYSPWQGGFYERLIKEVKFCINTTLGSAKLDLDGLLTVLKEIETSLNDRPLTYQEAEFDGEPIITAANLSGRNFDIVFPLEEVPFEAEDPDFLPSDQAAAIRTRNQAVSALHKSTAPRRQVINLFRERYMPSLRELHTLRINNQRGSSVLPRIGAIVLLDEPSQPRHAWPYGRIDGLPTNEGGVAREAVVYVPRTGRSVRRAINQLVPMELDDSEEIRTDQQPAVPMEIATVEMEAPRQYNLRARQPINYAERDESEFDDFVDRQVNFSTANYARYRPLRNTLPYFIMILVCLIPLVATTSTPRMECIPGGVRLYKGDSTAYQICAESYCITDLVPDQQQEFRFPAEVVIRDYKLHWKLQEPTRSWTMEDTCPAAPFCSSIDCTWCSALVSNPECWPRTAIAVTAVLLYLIVVGLYTLCYVPITTLRVGTACLQSTVKGLTWVGRLFCKGASRIRKSRPPLLSIRRIRRRIITAVTVVLILSSLTCSSKACQEVDILTSESTVCTKLEDGQENCHVKATELIKLNAFKRDACFRLSYGNKTVREYRLTWNNVLLDCVKDPMYYTRNTVYNVLDSKRCPRTGSCKGDKCSNITRQSLVPELEAANDKPGITGCVESCGGPGCDCFYLSSGCLFYRIFLTANDNSTYEVFSCTQWQEMLDMSVSVTRHGETATTRLTIRPNADFTVFGLKISLSTLTVPPSPILSRRFVTDGSNVALWPLDYQPPLRCLSADNATSMDCDVVEDCICTAAEIKIICTCKDRNITADFMSLTNRLPLFYPGISLLAYNGTSVRSSISTLSTTEIIASINDKVNTTVLAEDHTCTIGNLNIEGCYNCRDGGTATAICVSTAKSTIAEVRCGPDHFAIPCSNEGTATVLRFNFANAQINLKCNVHCGQKEHNFDITGILKFTGSLRNTAWKAVHGDSSSYSELQLPDFSHLLDVYLSWMKTCILASICLALALGLTYLYLNTVGLRWTAKLTALPLVLSMFFVRLFFRVLAVCFRRFRTTPVKPKQI